MRKKKVLALLTAGTMLMSSMTAFAATGDTSLIGGDQGGTSGEGGIDTVDTVVYKVTLPTAKALDFALDPQGLLGLNEGDKKADLKVYEGKIVPASGSGVNIVNTSSRKLKVDVKLIATDTATASAGALAVKPVATKELATVPTAATEPAMCLLAIPGNTNIDAIGNYVPSSVGIPITTKNASSAAVSTASPAFSFVLDPATYEYAKTASGAAYALQAGAANYDAASFRLGGYVNPKGDWSEYTKTTSPSKIGASAVFVLSDVGDKSDTSTVVGDFTTVHASGAAAVAPKGLMALPAYTATPVGVSVEDVSGNPSVNVAKTMNYSKTTKGPIVMPYSLGTAKAVTDVYVVDLSKSPNGVFQTAGDFVTKDGSNITLNQKLMEAYSAANQKLEVYVIFDGNNSTKLTLEQLRTGTPVTTITFVS